MVFFCLWYFLVALLAHRLCLGQCLHITYRYAHATINVGVENPCHLRMLTLYRRAIFVLFFFLGVFQRSRARFRPAFRSYSLMKQYVESQIRENDSKTQLSLLAVTLKG